MVDKKVWEKITLNWRMIFIIVFIVSMFFSIGMMYSPGSGCVYNGKIDLTGSDFKQNELVELEGQWEFYWNRLLTPGDFSGEQKPQIDSLMKVPGSWQGIKVGDKIYPQKGVATYRILLKYPATIKDPALEIRRVTRAYKLYANGQLIKEVGKVSDKASDFKADYKLNIIDLPKDTEQLELIIQVAAMDYPRGGIMETPVLGSKKVLEQKKMLFLSIQLLFIGSVIIFGIYYLFLFILQRKNRTALLFSILCFITAMRALVFGEVPLVVLFPKVTINILLYINNITAYNLVPIIILFVLSLYPLDYKKKILGLILMPTLFFDALLLTPIEFMALFNNYLYVLMLMQMIFILGVLIKAVIHRRENAILMFIVISIFALTIIEDVFHHTALGGINISYMFLYGNFIVIIAMSFVQAKLQANAHKKLILYNEKLVEADRLKDKIMATEMSFLQAQIKPHFLYNALSAIANVCEKDGKKAAKLIIDLAIYLRGSLEFNPLDKMVTVEKELEFINTYFNIEQARFGPKIQLIKEIEIPLEYQIPVLVIQPLVENAVRHGISKKQIGGRVIVRMTQLEEGIRIEIEDDGVGIEGEKLNLLLNEKRKNQGVGLLNIHHRLLRIYGRGLEITSQVGQGTCVKILITKGRK